MGPLERRPEETRRLVYVAGPMALGNMAHNISQAMEAGNALILAGFTPILPQLSFYMSVHYPHSWETWLDVDRPLVIGSDALLRLPGESRGAEQEVRWAIAERIPVFNHLEHLILQYKRHDAHHLPRVPGEAPCVVCRGSRR